MELMTCEERKRLRKTEEFKHTEKVWNELKCGASYKVGSLIAIANHSEARFKFEFEEYYLKTGRVREEILKTRKNLYEIEKIYLDKCYGRTYEDMLKIAKDLKKYIGLPLNILFNIVYSKIIDDAWVGYHREQRTKTGILCVLEKYNGFFIRHADRVQDTNLGVDFEICQFGKVICGIQVKGESYKQTRNKPNNTYKMITNCEIINAYVNHDGFVVNLKEIINYILKNAPYEIVKKNKTQSSNKKNSFI